MRLRCGSSLARWSLVALLATLLLLPATTVGAVSNNFVFLQKIDDPNGAAGDQFGLAVAISKDNVYAVVSAPGVGKVWVYTRDASGHWASPVLLPAPSPAPTGADSFGAALAISSDSGVGNRVILVGSYTGGGAVAGSGAVYAYRLTGASWSTSTPTRLTATTSVAADEFGRSVAINATGTVALIGSPVSGGVAPGSAYVFVRSGATWNPATPAKINPIAPATSVGGDHFGSGVALSDDGNTALIGANENNVNKHGEAYVYTGNGGNFSTASQKILSPSDGCTSPCGDFFGDSVSLAGDGKTALVGAWQHVDPGSGNPTGSAYVFTNSGGTWAQTDELNEGANNTFQDRFGWSVSLSGDGNTAAVGAIAWGQTFAAGAVWAYVRSSGHFQAFGDQPIQSPDANGKPNPPSGNDAFGWSVSLPQQGTHILIGEPLHTVGGTATTGGNDSQGEAFDYVLNVDLAPVAGALPAGTVGTAYSQQFTATGGAGGPYTYSSTGTLPPGLNLTAAGLLSGTPTTVGPYSFSITATDAGGGMVTQAYTLAVNPGAGVLTVNPPTLPGGTTGTPYSQQLTATGGSGTGYTFAAPPASLPPGLTLSAAGLLSGTPTQAGGPFTFTVTATDSAMNTGTRQYQLTVAAGAPAKIAVYSGNNQSAAVGSPYPAPLQAIVTDAQGKPVAGAAVTFKLASIGAEASFAGRNSATATTDANGIATSPRLTASGTAGQVRVVASTPGVTNTATFTLNNGGGGGGNCGTAAQPRPYCS